MSEFKSKVEDLVETDELLFPPTPAFGAYRPFLEQALAHPAKANVKLLEFLILKYTNPGDVILDPMAGSGSTGVVATLHGRNAILVELEPRFYEWMEEARRRVERHVTLAPKGKMRCLLGDARRISSILSNVDVSITSPPYSDVKRGGRADPERMAEKWDEKFREHGGKWDTWGRTWKTEGRMRGLEALGSGYSDSKDNIGNLPMGEIDLAITNPPYSGSGSSDGSPKYLSEGKTEYAREERGDGTLHVDVAITSPPYSESMSKKRKGYTVIQKLEGTREMPQDTRDDNIANIPHGDEENLSSLSINLVLTSPPYEGSLEGTSRHLKGGIASRDPALTTETYTTILLSSDKKGVPICYSPNKDNIGNLKSTDEEYRILVTGLLAKNEKPTYLSEMFKVYTEIFKVLKPGGRAIIIVKPFQRNKKIIDLPYSTLLLMKLCGFEPEHAYKLRLKKLSFWRVLTYKKHPYLPKITHEYILVMKKPSATTTNHPPPQLPPQPTQPTQATKQTDPQLHTQTPPGDA